MISEVDLLDSPSKNLATIEEFRKDDSFHVTIRIKPGVLPPKCLLAFSLNVKLGQTIDLFLNANRIVGWNIQKDIRLGHSIPLGNSAEPIIVTFWFRNASEAGLSSTFRRLQIVRHVEEICHVPFSKMDLRENFVPCCSEWLTDEYYEIDPGSDPWNGEQAQELRKSILRGDYSYCNFDRCIKKKSAIKDLKKFSIIPKENLKAIEAGLAIMPEAPRTICLHSDPRCNLSCPSCRPSMITKLTEKQAERISWERDWLSKHRQSIRRLFLASDGEVFFSPYLRETLKNVSLERYPNLEFVQINSNGLLFDERAMNDLRPGTDFIKEVQISVDAGNAETYRRVRGGNWEQLLKNLRWIAEQRAKGRFRRFQLNFVIRKASYQSIPDFVALGNELGVDTLHMTDFRDWKRAKIENFRSELVHLPEHPEYQKYCSIMQSSRNSRVRLHRSVDPLIVSL